MAKLISALLSPGSAIKFIATVELSGNTDGTIQQHNQVGSTEIQNAVKYTALVKGAPHSCYDRN